MEKCIFRYYQITMYGKKYKIYIPEMRKEELWITTIHVFHNYGVYTVVDRNALKWLRNAYHCLWKEPDSIMYFTVKRDVSFWFEYQQTAPDLVLYNHQIQLKRKLWKKLKQVMKYRKPEKRIIYYDLNDMKKQQENMMRQWRKRSTFYNKKLKDKSFYEQETYFAETSRNQALNIAVSIQSELETDLEAKLERRGYLEYTVGSLDYTGMHFEFAPRSFIERRNEEGWR